MREFLEKYYTEELVSTEKGTVKLAIRALLEVVQSGRKHLEIAVMRRGEPMQVMSENGNVFSLRDTVLVLGFKVNFLLP